MELLPAFWAWPCTVFALIAVISAQDQSLVVSTVAVEPWAFKDSSGRLDGFIPELLRQLGPLANLTFTIREAKDGYYGRQVAPGNWTGIIGEIENKEADLGGPLSQTAEREAVVDFSRPIVTPARAAIISLRYPTEVVEEADALFFLKPFSFGVWLFLCAAFLVSGCLILMYRHFWPYSKDQSVEPKQTDTFAEDTREAYWLIFVTLMLQGFEKRPRPLAARVLSAFWFMFTLLTLLMYVASLVSHLSVPWPLRKTLEPITNAEELEAQKNIQYGVVRGGNLHKFFNKTTNGLYAKMNKNMESQNTYVKDYADGIRKVKKGKFAFMLVAASADYYLKENCDMAAIGTIDNPLVQAIGVAKNSTFLPKLNDALLKLRERGHLQQIYTRWFRSPTCDKEEQEKPQEKFPTKISLTMYGGPLIVLLIGIVLSLVVFLVQFIYYRCCQQGSYSPNEKDVEAGKPQANSETEMKGMDKGDKKNEDKEGDKEGDEEGKQEDKEEQKKDDDKEDKKDQEDSDEKKEEKDKEEPAATPKETDKDGKEDDEKAEDSKDK